MADRVQTHLTPSEFDNARRAAFAVICLLTWSGIVGAMVWLLSHNGFTLLDGVMTIAFAGSTPMVVIGFWNALIGVGWLAVSRRAVDAAMPLQPAAIFDHSQRVAVVMPVFNEDPARVFKHLQSVTASLDNTALAGCFDVFLLADSTDPAIKAAENRYLASWKRRDTDPARLHLHRRETNEGYKAGNIRAFLETAGDAYDHMVVLDADSVMTGRAIERLIRTLQAHPDLGILQSLAVGLPARTPFARIFQFGMRHGMLTHTLGAAWWQGNAGPYWGHNAAIRVAPFKAACDLPTLPGKPPLGGAILSHDQVEAALMRAHGYQVRVLPIEDGSFEETPPTLPDFVERDLRWCQGNMQYLKLLTRRGFRAMGRVQLALAILMYLGAPFWLLFLLSGAVQVGGLTGPEIWPAASGGPGAGAATWGIALLVTMLGMTFAPKVLGYGQALFSRSRRRQFGGARPLLTGAFSEVAASVVLGPVVMVAQSLFILGLPFGRKVQWHAQRRDDHSIPFRAALRSFWPQTILGFGGLAYFALQAPALLPWALPVLIAWILAAPFAWATAHPALARGLQARGLCATPEELAGARMLPTGPAAFGVAGLSSADTAPPST